MSVLYISASVCFFSDFTYKQYHMIFVCLWPASLSMITCMSIHVAANGIISFFLKPKMIKYIIPERV